MNVARNAASLDATLGPSMSDTVWMLDARHCFTGSCCCCAAASMGLGGESAPTDATLGSRMCATAWMLDAKHCFTGSSGCCASSSIGLGGESAPTAALVGLSSLTFLPIRSKKQRFKPSFSQLLLLNSNMTTGDAVCVVHLHLAQNMIHQRRVAQRGM